MNNVDHLCKQFGSRWDPTQPGASSVIQIVWHLIHYISKHFGLKQ